MTAKKAKNKPSVNETTAPINETNTSENAIPTQENAISGQENEIKDPETATNNENSETTEQAKASHVAMYRDPQVYPDGPFSADVHPDEVENYKQGGWLVK